MEKYGSLTKGYSPATIFLGLVTLFFLFVVQCSTLHRVGPESDLPLKLQALVESMITVQGDDPIHNAVLLVDSPKITWKGAAGYADGKSEKMTADHTFKIASITKTFTATIILQMIEEGRLKYDDTIDMFLDNPVVKIDELHIHGGVSYGRRITIEHLLSHTSGIKDYMEDPRFIPAVLEHPQKQYDPAEILTLYYAYDSNKKAVFPPGTNFDYSDVNYVLLAMIIEQVNGDTYQSQLNSRIFSRLGMKNSYVEHYEKPRGYHPLSFAFFSTVDLIEQVNTSFDWGGGGLISTCSELNTFFRALLDGQLFKNEATLRKMLTAADLGRGGQDYDYGLGIMKRSIHGLTFYGHGGAYDCDVYFCPEKNISVCLSLNQMNTHGKRDKFLFQAVKIVM